MANEQKIAGLTDEVGELHPLLRQLLPKLRGVLDVEYTHGNREMGADFVLSRTHDIFGTEEYIGVIAKVGKILQDYSDIERQIEECAVPRTFFGGKRRIQLDEIWVLTTGSISKNAQEKIHEKYRSSKIFFIDGPRLSRLVDEHLPDFWTDIGLEIGEYLSSLKTSNAELDRLLSLVPLADKSFYVKQDIVRVSTNGFKGNPKKSEGVDIVREIESNNVLLVEGGMGAGKSKLLRHLTDHYAATSSYNETRMLPITITFRELEDTFNGDVSKVIESKIGHLPKEVLTESTCLLLIDAADEKNLDIGEHILALQQIADSITARPNTKAVITSRYVSGGLYGDPNLGAHIARYDIRPLTFSKLLTFITTLCTKLNVRTRIIEDLRKSQLLRELPHSPIAAILLAQLLDENSRDVPANMTELYSKYIELSLGRWDIEKGLQSQKEYEVLDTILMELAAYMITNDIVVLGTGEVRTRFAEYLGERNLAILPDDLYERAIRRSDILTLNPNSQTVSFKHRSFAEFLYAKYLFKTRSLIVDERVYSLYWTNTYFFYLGIEKDSSELLPAIIRLEPQSEGEKWMRYINLPNYLLAAYATPYSVIEDAVAEVFTEVGRLFLDIVDVKFESFCASLSRVQLLWLFQYLARQNYSFEFFKSALENAALSIAAENHAERYVPYALFLLNIAYAELDPSGGFDFLLQQFEEGLPLEITLALRQEGKRLGESPLLKKAEKRFMRSLKGNKSLFAKIEELRTRPISRPVNPQLLLGRSRKEDS